MYLQTDKKIRLSCMVIIFRIPTQRWKLDKFDKMCRHAFRFDFAENRISVDKALVPVHRP